MKLRHLQAFVAVAEARSFGRAARELSVAQPALSKQVAALERELGAALFVRGPREVALTPAGEAFIGEARGLLETSERAVARTRAAANSTAGTLHLGCAEMMRPHEALLASALATLVGRHPRLTVASRRMSSAEQWAALRERRLHVGLGYGVPPEGTGLAHEHVAALTFTGVLLPAEHPLASRGLLRFADLAGLPLLFFPRDVNPPLHDCVMAGLRERGLEPELRTWPHMHSAYETAVGAGLGWMLAVEEMRELPDGVVARPVDEAAMTTHLTVWWREDEAGPPVRAFVEAARTAR
ncbi:MAG TPA: LysR substrate-binding domain-containing protein [Longimicrobiaceae bacterium]|jgi:DNA-binding transcriptional LysR family regulator